MGISPITIKISSMNADGAFEFSFQEIYAEAQGDDANTLDPDQQHQHTLELQRQNLIQTFLLQSPQLSGSDLKLHDTANHLCHLYRKNNPAMMNTTTKKRQKTKIRTKLDPSRQLTK